MIKIEKYSDFVPYAQNGIAGKTKIKNKYEFEEMCCIIGGAMLGTGKYTKGMMPWELFDYELRLAPMYRLNDCTDMTLEDLVEFLTILDTVDTESLEDFLIPEGRTKEEVYEFISRDS